MQDILTFIHSLAKEKQRPDSSSYRSLSHNDETTISERFGVSRREIQILALENDITPERYARNQNYLSMLDQVRLLKSHIGVVGLGGLGGAVTEILSRVGVGLLTLVDGDVFDESNLNRQLLSSTTNLGRSKSDVAAERVRDINPAIEAKPVATFLSEENGEPILRGTNYVIDCLDTIDTRFCLEDVCTRLNIPLISGAIGGTSGQAITIEPGTGVFSRIYGPRSKSPRRGIEASLGTMAYGAVSISALLCLEAVSLITGRPSLFTDKLMLADFSIPSIDIARLS